MGGRRVYEPMHTVPHTYRILFDDGVDHKTAILTRMTHAQLLLTAEQMLLRDNMHLGCLHFP